VRNVVTILVIVIIIGLIGLHGASLEGSKPPQDLAGKRVAYLIENGYNHFHASSIIALLESRGADVYLVSPTVGDIFGSVEVVNDTFINPYAQYTVKPTRQSSHSLTVDLLPSQVDLDDFSALIVTGGMASSDKLAADKDAALLIQQFAAAGKVIGGHSSGATLLARTGIMQGKRMTGPENNILYFIQMGAVFEKTLTLVHGNIVTGQGFHGDYHSFASAVGDLIRNN